MQIHTQPEARAGSPFEQKLSARGNSASAVSYWDYHMSVLSSNAPYCSA